jgi:hypothetical protein
MSKPRRQEVVTSRLGEGDVRGGIEEERSGSPGDYSIAPPGPRLSSAALTGLDCRFVALRPRLDVALRRNRERSIWTVDESVLAELHAMLEGPHTDGWLVVDNSEGSPDETATAVAGGLGLLTPSR